MKVMPQDLQRVQMLAQQYQQTKTVAQQLALQQEQQAKQGPPNPEVEAFLAQYPQIQPHAAARLRALPRDAQMQVLMLGGLGKARDPTAMLLGRIRNVDPFNATWVPRNPGMQPFPAPAAAPGAAMMNMQVASMVPANPSAPPPPPVETPKARAVEAPKKVATTYEDENEYDKWAAMAEGQLAAAKQSSSSSAASSDGPIKKPMLSDWRRTRPAQGEEVFQNASAAIASAASGGPDVDIHPIMAAAWPADSRQQDAAPPPPLAAFVEQPKPGFVFEHGQLAGKRNQVQGSLAALAASLLGSEIGSLVAPTPREETLAPPAANFSGASLASAVSSHPGAGSDYLADAAKMAEQSIFGGVAPPEDFSQFPAAFNLPPPPAPVAPAAGGIRAMLAARLGGGLAQDPAVAQRAQVQAEAAELLSWSRQDLGAFPPAGPAFNQFDAGGAGGGSTFLQSPAFAKSSGAPPSGFGGLPSGLGGGDFGGGLGGLAGLPSSFTSAASSSSQAPAPDYISEETMASLPASMRVLIQARQQAAQATAAATALSSIVAPAAPAAPQLTPEEQAAEAEDARKLAICQAAAMEAMQRTLKKEPTAEEIAKEQADAQAAAAETAYQNFWVQRQMASLMSLYQQGHALQAEKKVVSSGNDYWDGDWKCSKCGDHQFARNRDCRNCGEVRKS